MKTIPSNAQAQLDTLEGTEPLIIVGIEWTSTNTTFYSDTDLTGTKSKLLSVGEIEDVVIGENHTSQSCEIVLDDTDGEIKSIINQTNIYKVKVTVYQYFKALSDLGDKFVLLKGQIQTPFIWDELQRSVSFTILNEIESFEVGFSPEEGQLPFVTFENIGKPWPLCFGSPIHVPAQRVGKAIENFASGILAEDFGIVDPVLYFKLENLRFAYNQEKFLLKWWMMVIQGAKSVGRTSKSILDDYMLVINAERVIFQTIALVITKLNKANKLKEQGINQVALIKALEEQLQFLSIQSNSNAFLKESLEKEAELSTFVQNLTRNAYKSAVDSFNQIKQIYREYILVSQEICRQARLAKETILIYGGDKFVQNTEIELLINQVKFRGTFSGELFHIIAGPLPTFTNVAVDTWKRDPDACAPTDETNGLAIFWLLEEPPVNLVGMYLYVRSRIEDTKHLIKVERQDGLKVIYTLVSWSDNTTVDDKSMSVDEAINQLLNLPTINTPWGQVPADLYNGGWSYNETFGIVPDLNGVWAGSPWNTPEGRTIITAMASVPGGVNRHEIEVIAHLVYGVSYDSLGDDLLFFEPDPREIFTIIGEDVAEILAASPIVLTDWINNVPLVELPASFEWKAESGATVVTGDKNCDVYICNILPSSIKSVFAFRTIPLTGKRIFAQVPSNYYVKNESANLGTINVTALTFPRTLSTIAGEGWEDDVFVTLTSSVGPNVCDVIQHLIETYTIGGTVNVANFAATKAKFLSGSDELYPVNFVADGRPNVLDYIARIAWEARCAIYKVGNEFFLKYLSEEPTTNKTLTLSDIDSSENIKVTYSSTENIVTRLVCFWQPDYKPLEPLQRPYRQIFRHNVKLYNVHSEEVTFHIYNDADLVRKSATFWLIRKANAWKQIQIKTFLYNVDLDVFDTVLFDLPSYNSGTEEYFSNNAVKSVVLQANYNPSDNSINLLVEVPIKADSMDKYDLYWPAQVSEATLFPTVVEIEKGYAGGYGPGSGVKGTITDC